MANSFEFDITRPPEDLHYDFVQYLKQFWRDHFSMGRGRATVRSAINHDVADTNEAIANDEFLNDDNFWTYLDGLFTAQGAENAVNRDYNSAEAALNRDFQASEAAKQREWYSQLSSSAYQRSVQDLKAAGLNPILAAGGSMAASSSATQVPTGSAASMNVPGGDSLSNIISSLAQVMSALGNNTKGKAAILGAILKFVK